MGIEKTGKIGKFENVRLMYGTLNKKKEWIKIHST